MKKYITAALISITILSTLTGCGNNRDIGKDEATRIALEDAGLSESDISRFKVSKDRDDGRTIYEVQFTGQNTEYDYEILASTGEIISLDTEETYSGTSRNQQEKTQTEQNVQQDNSGQQQSSSQSNVQITQEEAARLALERVPGATEQDLRMELDFDDGYYQYEGDIIYDQKEYEFEIDANSGTFLKWSEERR